MSASFARYNLHIKGEGVTKNFTYSDDRCFLDSPFSLIFPLISSYEQQQSEEDRAGGENIKH